MSCNLLWPTSTSARLVRLADAPDLAELVRANRDFLAAWEPVRDDDYFTVGGQRAVIEAALAAHARGVTLPYVVLDASSHVVGLITLDQIVHGPFRSCDLGFWIGWKNNGRGLATRAVRDIIRVASDDLQLHRIQAATQPHNVKAQHVLERNGFVRFGVAPSCPNVAGTRQDHALYHVTLAPNDPSPIEVNQ
jgi:[ribosomal protein S5]-alanine N-acetyltransferase